METIIKEYCSFYLFGLLNKRMKINKQSKGISKLCLRLILIIYANHVFFYSFLCFKKSVNPLRQTYYTTDTKSTIQETYNCICKFNKSE